MKYSEFKRLLGIIPMLFIIISNRYFLFKVGIVIEIILMKANRYYLLLCEVSCENLFIK